MEAAFATAVLETVKLIAPPREGRLMPGRGWRGNVQVEAELNTAITARLVAWRRQKADKQGNQLKRAVLDSHLLLLFYASWLSVEALCHS